MRKEWVTGENDERVLETELFWLWPFYGRYDRTDEEHSGYAAWPIVFWWDDLAVKGRDHGLIVVPFWKDQWFVPDDGSPPDRSWKAWPIAWSTLNCSTTRRRSRCGQASRACTGRRRA